MTIGDGTTSPAILAQSSSGQSSRSRRDVLGAGALIAAAAAAPLSAATRSSKAPQAPAKPRTYVLVHGAWHGGWVWKQTAAALRALGHTVYTPSLAGMGEHRHELRPGINLTTHADGIVNLIQLEDLANVVLVGWSYGGMVISEVLARITDRIGGMIYLDAFVPDRGKSLLDYASVPVDKAEAARLATMGKDMAPISPEVMGVKDPQLAALLNAGMCPQPVMTFMQESGALAQRPNIPHLYIVASDSPAYAVFGPMRDRVASEPMFKTHAIHSSHALMLTAPQQTLELLNSIAV